MRRIAAVMLLLALAVWTGCSSKEPFLFTVEKQKVLPKHQQEVDNWLKQARTETEPRIFAHEIGDYRYLYVKGYNDVEMSYIYEHGEGKLKQRFIKGNEQDELLVQVHYNPAICCSTYIYETSDADELAVSDVETGKSS